MDQDIRHRVWAVICKYARPHPTFTQLAGRTVPMRCTPSLAERESGRTILSNKKIIYDGWDNAKRAAQEIFQATGHRTTVYTCHRSPNRRHKHLTTDEEWMRAHDKGRGSEEGGRAATQGGTAHEHVIE